MAIKYLAGNVLEGLSTDTKPTTVPAQSRFRETDTLVDWKFDGTDWFEMTGCFNPNTSESFTNKNLSDSTNTFRTWVNADISSSAAIGWPKISKTGSILGDIANVSITSVAVGDRFAYDGTNWINSKVPLTPINFAGPASAITTVTLAYYPIANNVRQATEANVQMTIPYNLIIKRLMAKFNTNALTAATPIAFRDDGATATSISIPAGSTAEVDSGAISITVASGSKINWMVDTSGSTANNWLPAYIVAWCLVY